MLTKSAQNRFCYFFFVCFGNAEKYMNENRFEFVFRQTISGITEESWEANHVNLVADGGCGDVGSWPLWNAKHKSIENSVLGLLSLWINNSK